MLNRVRRIIVPLILVVAAPLAAGCGSKDQGTQTGSTSSALASTSGATSTTAPVTNQATKVRGPARAAELALAKVTTLRDDQRTQLEALVAKASARTSPTPAAERDFRTALAAEVKAGKIDRDALKPQLDAVRTARESDRDAGRADMDQLKTILDADQQTALRDAMKSERGEHKHHGRGAKTEEQDKAHAKRDETRGAWVKELGLTDAQETQIHEALKSRFEAMRAKHEADANENTAEHAHGFRKSEGGEHGSKGRWMRHRGGDAQMLGFLETVVPVLTPAQREIAAQKILRFGEHHAP
jgi:Spy/CpxP family protein refolding chaperone